MVDFRERWQGLQLEDRRDAPPVWDPTPYVQQFPKLSEAQYANPGSYFAEDAPIPAGQPSPMSMAMGFGDIQRANLLDVLRLMGYDVSGVTGMKK